MAYPSPQAVAAVRQRVTDWAPDDATIAGVLNTPDRPNPVPQGTVPKPMVAADMLGAISAASVAKVYARPAITAFADSIAAQNRASAANWIAMALTAADITQPEYATLVGMVQATQPDPAWPAQISWADAVIGRPVDANDVAASRQGV